MNAVEVYDLSASAVEESQKTLAGDCFSRRISRKDESVVDPCHIIFGIWDLGYSWKHRLPDIMVCGFVL